jgi:hypothetical protein
MNVLFFEPFGIWTPHFETCLELMQEQSDKGASITFIRCDASLPACEPNPDHDLTLCLRCISKRNKELKLLKITSPFTSISLDDLLDSRHENVKKSEWNFSSVRELCEYKIDNYDIGMAVASSLMSIYRTPEPDLVIAKDRLAKLLDASCRTYYAMKKYMLEKRPDAVFIFNGRFSFLRSVFRICRQHGIDCYTHERGANIHKYAVYKNALPHDWDYTVHEIRESWAKAQVDHRVAVAEQFYLDRAGGKQQSWLSYVTNQENGLLPEGWDPHKKNLAIFNSSEDEFAATGDEWLQNLYATQLVGVNKIVQDLSTRDNVHVYLRMHPNLVDVHNESVEGLYRIRANNFTVIPPESKVSTYALIRASHNVITFGSTVGIEAAFWGKPSILAGQSFYSNLGSVYYPESHEELVQMALSDLQPKDRTGALMYGYYLNTFGRDFKYYKADDLFTGRFKGKTTKPPFIIHVVGRLIGISRLQRLNQFNKLFERYLKGIS